MLKFAVVALSAVMAVSSQQLPQRTLPGTTGEVTTLPNGWRIAPAGRHVEVSTMPLNMILSPDGRYVIVSNDGYSKPTFSIVDTRTLTVASTFELSEAWLGLAWHPDGRHFFSSGQNSVSEFSFEDGKVTAGRTFPLGPSASQSAFAAGLAVRPDGKRLFVARVLAQSLVVVNTETGKVEKDIALPAEPYTCVTSRDGKLVFVSLWGGAKVLAFDAVTLAPAGEVVTGEHPNAMLLTPDGSTLYVACANTNAVWVVDVKSLTAKEQIGVALYPDSPAGSTPNALALSPDGKRLLVANADNNAIAVISIMTNDSADQDHQANDQRSVVGFIPTGWYPTGVMFSLDGKTIFSLSGKGLRSTANPRGPNPTVSGSREQYIAALLPGALSAIPMPDEAALRRYTSAVYSLTPYTAATRFAPAGAPANSPIPAVVGAPSPIKYVFYVIRENRTYDQVFGDMPKGNGDPKLALFDAKVTPNAHALASTFVLFDNFYVNAEVSYQGHAYSTAAYSTDLVEKMWPANYARRGGAYLSEGGGNMRNAYGNIAAPSEGYIWDACTKAGLSVRTYGEFVERARDAGVDVIRASVPGLEGKFNPDFAPFDLRVTDVSRVDVWEKEFRQFLAAGTVPRLSIVRLGRDHTSGARAGEVSPRSMVADNDLALGRLVDIISHSSIWKESAIFVLEDDAQNGPDHVDAHRSVLLVVSPYTKRQAVDSTMYTTVGILRTMELILGLPPMSQLDAAAAPLYNAFQATPNLAPYSTLRNLYPLDEINPKATALAKAAEAFDFEEADRAPDDAFSVNVWKAVRGADSVMPPPRRAAFIKALAQKDRD